MVSPAEVIAAVRRRKLVWVVEGFEVELDFFAAATMATATVESAEQKRFPLEACGYSPPPEGLGRVDIEDKLLIVT